MDSTTPHAAAEVLWVRGHGGCRPGAFHRHLIDAITASSSDSRALLRQVFPAYVAAVELAQRGPAGVESLARVAATPALTAVP